MLDMLLIDNPVVTNCLIDQVCCWFSLGSHKYVACFNFIVQLARLILFFETRKTRLKLKNHLLLKCFMNFVNNYLANMT